MMFVVQIQVREYLDRRPVEGARITVRAEAVARFLMGYNDPDDPEPEPVIIAEPDFDRPQRSGEVTVTSDQNGFAEAMLDVADVHQAALQLRRGGTPAFDAVILPF